ncbi:P-loop containing nucleoside triphosphate hydrolase protein [Apiospora phragmitis]|uniref:P-loop containing nucleoside triphosphate hydrolase protein n=1 Tax=Apiospora phragmitis TaxID=2905665 RepID=A0ABR1VCB2_9PEZI
MTVNSNCSDDAFGPALSCHGSFDFTLLYRVWRSTTKTYPSRVLAGKAILSVLLFGLQISLVALWSKIEDSVKTAVPYAVVSLIASGALSASAVLVEHDRSLRPSLLFIIYLFTTCFFDIV